MNTIQLLSNYIEKYKNNNFVYIYITVCKTPDVHLHQNYISFSEFNHFLQKINIQNEDIWATHIPTTRRVICEHEHNIRRFFLSDRTSYMLQQDMLCDFFVSVPIRKNVVHVVLLHETEIDNTSDIIYKYPSMVNLNEIFRVVHKSTWTYNFQKNSRGVTKDNASKQQPRYSISMRAKLSTIMDTSIEHTTMDIITKALDLLGRYSTDFQLEIPLNYDAYELQLVNNSR